jgi:hypothetical protein
MQSIAITHDQEKITIQQRVTISMEVGIFMKIYTVNGEAQKCCVAPISKKHGFSPPKVFPSNRIAITNHLPPALCSGSQVNF